MKSLIKLFILLLIVYCSTPNEDNVDVTTTESFESTGDKMVLMGHSFFKPYANKLPELAEAAGIEGHDSQTFFRGGENGLPENLWQDNSINDEIKTALDAGGVDVFGMVMSPYSSDGHKLWIEYALQNNSGVEIMIAIPVVDFPSDWDGDERFLELGYNNIYDFYPYYIDLVAQQVDELRAEFPNTNIFSVDYGQSIVRLNYMLENDLLLDDINHTGSFDNSLYTDYKGHQGDIAVKTGSLVWLKSLYSDVDLNEFEYDTGFDTDLLAIAQEAYDNHNPLYKRN